MSGPAITVIGVAAGTAHPRPTPLLPVCLLALTALACTADQPLPTPPPVDPLIVAITDVSGFLTPIGRYADGIWDLPPWAVPFRLESLAAVPVGDSSTWRWPDGRRTWPEPGRAVDTTGFPASAVAVNVPDRWYFHSERIQGMPLGTDGLRLWHHPCAVGWRVRTQARRSRQVFPDVGDYRTAGVSLSRTPTAVLPAEEWPDVERVVAELELRDPDATRDPDFIWLGVFRFDDMTLGVLHRLRAGFGVQHAVIELHGDRPRMVASEQRSMC